MLCNEMQSQGRWLFRWRSYLPMLFSILFIPAFWNFQYPLGSRTVMLIWGGGGTLCRAVRTGNSVFSDRLRSQKHFWA
ncbi:MAG: hypothetical protein LBK06_06475 [Planctomycetaceae bacterium]|jgi:hypothetical protein|nr:hypothetical protein [Planctomycetaceae bacterium]